MEIFEYRPNQDPEHFLKILQWWGKTAKGPIHDSLQNTSYTHGGLWL
jgi:hypothetical protein